MYQPTTLRQLNTRIITCLLAVLAATMPSWVNAGKSSWPTTSRDFALLPSYCLYRSHKSQYPAQHAKWERLLGRSGWIHIHHYCYGMFALYHARATFDPEKKQEWIRIALDQWDYVDKRWPRNFKLRPELHVKRGDTYMTAGSLATALSEYQKAIALKPDYSLPYLRLADYYIEQDKPEEALEWVKKGLQKAPKSRKAFQRRLNTLDKAG